MQKYFYNVQYFFKYLLHNLYYCVIIKYNICSTYRWIFMVIRYMKWKICKSSEILVDLVTLPLLNVIAKALPSPQWHINSTFLLSLFQIDLTVVSPFSRIRVITMAWNHNCHISWTIILLLKLITHRKWMMIRLIIYYFAKCYI